ncbi:sialate O-acetylesterase [Singulisphaera sp. PoT]|uniref:sialate O-acetylesterase n=1 Tax=Singulisphaera sp. PoT TaxID=3411797 RepID=UPI003BF5B70D
MYESLGFPNPNRSRLRRWKSSALPALALMGIGLVFAPSAPAQIITKVEGAEDHRKPIAILEPTPFRVYQRGNDNRADISISLSDGLTAEDIENVSLFAHHSDPLKPAIPVDGWSYREGVLKNVPVGGPYLVNVTLKLESVKKLGADATAFSIGRLFVGDLWVLAGQSNMEGVGDLVDVTPPSNLVSLLGMNGKWSKAEEPLHWLVDSPDPVHSLNPADREARSKAFHKARTKGTGLGLPFATVLASTTNVPIGLIACAHGGTSMAQWDPAKKGEGGNSLYGSMLRQFKLAGGKVRGVLWYQGEAEANPDASKIYPRVFADFIAAVRSDFGQPDLPFYLVQLGRFSNPSDPKFWNAVQEAQRLIPDRIPNTAVVAAVDLDLDDGIHIGTPGLKRLGARLARIAIREVFGQAGATTPTLERVSKLDDRTLAVKFKGVNRVDGSGFPQTPAHHYPGFAKILDAPKLGPQEAAPYRGLQPARHIGGFSIRKPDGTIIPIIFDARVGPSQDTVLIKLDAACPPGAELWYGHGLDPYCNLTDALDMAVPVFGPVPLDPIIK